MSEEPHDRLFKQTFQSPENAAVELRAVLPPSLLSKVSLSTLETLPSLTVGKDLSVRHCDLLYRADIAGAPGYIYLLLEHQSTVDPLMPFRVLEYVVRVISRHVEESKTRLPLPVVIPVVVHHSETGWTAKTEVAELFAPGVAKDADLDRFQADQIEQETVSQQSDRRDLRQIRPLERSGGEFSDDLMKLKTV